MFLNRNLEKEIFMEVLDSMRKFAPNEISGRYWKILKVE